MPDQRRLERLRRNEEMFREVNARIAEVAGPFAEIADDSAVAFVCECSRAECVEQVEVPLDDYRTIRGSSDQFIVLPGHDEPEIEDVVRREGGYLVVRKRI